MYPNISYPFNITDIAPIELQTQTYSLLECALSKYDAYRCPIIRSPEFPANFDFVRFMISGKGIWDLTIEGCIRVQGTDIWARYAHIPEREYSEQAVISRPLFIAKPDLIRIIAKPHGSASISINARMTHSMDEVKPSEIGFVDLGV